MSTIFNNWDNVTSEDRIELVFENRNKAYGAYKIRKEFSKNQIMAMIVAVGFAFILTGGTLIYNKWQNTSKGATKAKVITKIETLDELEEPEEEIKEPEPELKEPEPQVETQAYVVPKIDETAKNDDADLFDPNKIKNPASKTKDGIDDQLGLFDPSKMKGPTNTGGKGKGPVKVAIKASYPGGDQAFAQYIIDNLIYPERCKQEGIAGYVRLQFIVDVKGRVSKVTPLDETKSCREFTKEAIRVLKETKWIPGNTNGKFFPSYRVVPISLSFTE
jgi:protein TonB